MALVSVESLHLNFGVPIFCQLEYYPIGTSERGNELWANGCHSGSEENTFAEREEKGIEGIL